MNLEKISSQNLNKELAYLFGVYLTDGSFSTQNKNFSLKAIDKDFVERTLNCIKKIIPTCKANLYIQKARERTWSNGKISKCKDQYCIGAGFSPYKEFFESQTNKKHHIPFLIWDAPLPIKKWFIAGVMDGDGYICYHTRPNKKLQWTIGIGKGAEGWIYEFKQLLHEMEVFTNKEERDWGGDRYKVPMVRFNIKINDFVKRGLFFTINRKQERLLNFIKKGSETKRCAS